MNDEEREQHENLLKKEEIITALEKIKTKNKAGSLEEVKESAEKIHGYWLCAQALGCLRERTVCGEDP